MSAQRRIASKVLPILAEAGWIESSVVSETDIDVKWTPKGEKRRQELLHLAELPRVINGPELAFLIYLAHIYFSGPYRAMPPERPEI